MNWYQKKSSEIDATLRQISFEKEKLSAYDGMLNQIKSHINRDQFEEAKMMLEMKGKMAEHQLNVIQRKDEMEMDKQEHRVEMVKGVEKHSQDMEMSKEKHEKDMSQKKEKSKE